jgi:hypothetical protein
VRELSGAGRRVTAADAGVTVVEAVKDGRLGVVPGAERHRALHDREIDAPLSALPR